MARGQNYALPHSKKDVFEFLAVTDSAVDKLENATRDDKLEMKSQILTAVKSIKKEQNLPY